MIHDPINIDPSVAAMVCDGTSALSPKDIDELTDKHPSKQKRKRNKLKSVRNSSDVTDSPVQQAQPVLSPGPLSVIMGEAKDETAISRESPVSETAESSPEPVSKERNDVFIPMGYEYVRTDGELPFPDNRRTMPEASGIIYEIADDLYRREKTATEIEALAQPPFRRVFDRNRIKELDRQAKAEAETLLSVPADTAKAHEQEKGTEKKPFTTARAFLLQLVFMIPVINLVTALVLSFGRSGDASVRAYSRGFVIWSAVFLSAALCFFAVSYFTEPAHSAVFLRLASVFRH